MPTMQEDLEIRRRVTEALRVIKESPAYLFTVGEISEVAEVLRMREEGGDQFFTADRLEQICQAAHERRGSDSWLSEGRLSRL